MDRPSSVAVPLVLFALVALAACGGSTPSIEIPLPDGGVITDGGVMPDGGTASDAGVISDGGTFSDGGVMPDGGVISDGGTAETCGNGVVDPGETCDTAISSGQAGACPTSCDDGVACTTDALNDAGTCLATCSYTAITKPVDGDGCCPVGANAATDSDCPASCGDGIIEAGEQCDDGPQNGSGSCSNRCTWTPTAYRFQTLSLQDPHIFINFIGCTDFTSYVDSQFTTSLTQDGDGDGNYDLSPTVVFRPLVQSDGGTSELDFHFADCPADGGACEAGQTLPTVLQQTSRTAGQCLAPYPGTTNASYMPWDADAGAPCFVSTAGTVSLTLEGSVITLQNARAGATYDSNPATQLAPGLLEGFVSEAEADGITVTTPIGDYPLSALLPGGTSSCATYSDMDILDGGTDGGTPGWWFYLNFTATKTPWYEP